MFMSSVATLQSALRHGTAVALTLCLSSGCEVYDPELLPAANAQPARAGAPAAGRSGGRCPLCRLGEGQGGAGAQAEASVGAAAGSGAVLVDAGAPSVSGGDAGVGGCRAGDDCCPNDALKNDPGVCGCNVAETDWDH